MKTLRSIVTEAIGVAFKQKITSRRRLIKGKRETDRFKALLIALTSDKTNGEAIAEFTTEKE